MATEILLPELGFSMNEGTLAEWAITDGGAVKEGEILFLLESDKSTTEVEAPASGTLWIVERAGADHPVGTLLGVIE